MTQVTDTRTTEQRLAHLEEDVNTLLHVLADAVQRLPRPGRFQVQASGSLAETNSSAWMVLDINCSLCGLSDLHRVDFSVEGLLVRCGDGRRQRATPLQRDLISGIAAQYLGNASFERAQGSGVVQLRPRASEVLP